jgi:hypothetical protein
MLEASNSPVTETTVVPPSVWVRQHTPSPQDRLDLPDSEDLALCTALIDDPIGSTVSCGNDGKRGIICPPSRELLA